MPEDDRKVDAAVVEAGERGEPEAYLVVQKYKSMKETAELEKLGKPLLVGMAKQLLAAAEPAIQTVDGAVERERISMTRVERPRAHAGSHRGLLAAQEEIGLNGARED